MIGDLSYLLLESENLTCLQIQYQHSLAVVCQGCLVVLKNSLIVTKVLRARVSDCPIAEKRVSAIFYLFSFSGAREQ